MKQFHRMVLRMLPLPMVAWLGVLKFLLVMQFLIKYLPQLVGKGLPFLVIAELIVYNLAYMLVLAVPMAALIATLMAFGRLAESNAYVVIKGSGVSFPQLVWPVYLAGILLTGFMWIFNTQIHPEANFRARNLWQDIRVAKPGLICKLVSSMTGLKTIKSWSKKYLTKTPTNYEISQYLIIPKDLDSELTSGRPPADWNRSEMVER